MTQFISFFIILAAGLVFSAVFSRLHLPWVVALIIAGIAIGPQGFGIFEPNDTISFLGEIGLVFLMFMAGLETKIANVKKHAKSTVLLAVLNGLIPMAVGITIALAFGYDWPAALLLGIIFISTSIAVVVPSLEANGLFHSWVGGAIVAATIVEDVASLLLLSVLLQLTNPTTSIPLWLFYPMLILALVALRWVIPRARWLFSFGRRGVDLFQQELRIIFVLLIGVVIVFELLGLHHIIAGFFAGLVLSKSAQSKILHEKLRALSYGLFIPIFFVIIGTKTDIRVFTAAQGVLALTAIIVAGSLIAKFVSGFLGARLAGLNNKQSTLVGVATTPQLTTTLAVAFAGLELGLLDQKIVTALVILSIITALTGPLLINALARRIKFSEELEHPAALNT